MLVLKSVNLSPSPPPPPHRFGARRLYVGGQLVYAVGAAAMASFPSVTSVFVFSPTAGVMYGTLFTMPYILVAHYHATNVFEEEEEGGTYNKGGEEEDVEDRKKRQGRGWFTRCNPLMYFRMRKKGSN